MGYNTTVIVYNDALNSIEDDKDFGKSLAKAVKSLSISDGRHVDVPSGCHCNAAMVVETHHADQTQVIAVGGNCGQVVGWGGSWRLDMRKPEDKIELLKNLADQLGYNLSKKPERKD
tara:strand:- start:586 stop:936 length:351 start_codon:yes stop_codon:yes gene_type:complete